MAEAAEQSLDTLVVYVPVGATQAVLDAVFAAGAGAIGRYRECAFVSSGRGQFRPLPGSAPAIGTTNDLEYVDEHRIEVVLPSSIRRAVVAAMRAAHPYEEPAFYVVTHATG